MCDFLLATWAAPDELQEVAFNTEPRLPTQLLLQFLEVATGEIDNPAARRAYKVVVMLVRSSQQVAAPPVVGMHFTDEPHLSQDIEGSVDSHQPDARVLLTHLLVDITGREVPVAVSDHL